MAFRTRSDWSASSVASPVNSRQTSKGQVGHLEAALPESGLRSSATPCASAPLPANESRMVSIDSSACLFFESFTSAHFVAISHQKTSRLQPLVHHQRVFVAVTRLYRNYQIAFLNSLSNIIPPRSFFKNHQNVGLLVLQPVHGRPGLHDPRCERFLIRYYSCRRYPVGTDEMIPPTTLDSVADNL